MNFNFLDSVNPIMWYFLVGLAVGVFLEVIAVFLTYLVFKSARHSPQPIQLARTRRTEQPKPKPVQPIQESRMEQVGLGVPKVAETRTGSVMINRSSPAQPIEVKPVMQPVTQPVTRPALQPVAQSSRTRAQYLYYVDGYDGQITTLSQALNVLGKQVSNKISYEQLGEDTRAKIRRELVTE